MKAIRLLFLAPAAALVLALGPRTAVPAGPPQRPFEIRIVDRQTKRGIPLVELVTVDQVRWVTDSAGRVAYDEPQHFGQTIYFTVIAPGYKVEQDGFGFAGARWLIEPGGAAELALERINLAERLYRATGQDIYRDSLRLDHPVPLAEPLGSGMVAGQDSVQAALYRGKIFWFWGDTLRLSYPLGHFRTAGATSLVPDEGGLRPSEGIHFEYFTGDDGFSRPMAHLSQIEGMVWIDGVSTVRDAAGQERLLAHFSRRQSLAKALAQGLMLYDDERERFEAVATLNVDDEWRFIRDHPLEIKVAGEDYLACGNPFPVTRVPARLEDIIDPSQYRSWSCVEPGADPKRSKPRRNAEGRLDWRWQAGPPVTQHDEARWLKAGLIKPDEARFLPEDAAGPGRRVEMHSGTVRYNAYRRAYVMVAIEVAWHSDSPSFLGEVWYSQAPSPQGPWQKAVRIVTHDKQSFYNPCHHPFFDEDGGRVIYFEGTYANTFTQSPATPRYNYNQIMYRLELDHPRLVEVFGPPSGA